MIRKIVQMSLLGGLLFAGAAVAELKIAVLDTQRALAESDEAKSWLAQAQESLKSDELEVKNLADSMRALQEKLAKDGEVMGAAEQRKVQKEMEDKQIDYQFKVNKLQKELTDRRNELIQQMVPKVDAVLKDLIEVERYDMILERSNLRYANSKYDITRTVTEKLNEKR